MSLTEYKRKRDFKSSPEPKGGRTKADQLIFVVQKHDATTLHYDFRLEMEGVLKSWAVPKGPSLDPADKRLAMMVEDHPYDYKDFEGIIAEGNYGAGPVIVWDKGSYEPIEEIESKKAREKHLLKQLEEGSLKFHLHGEKLKGEFALVRTRMTKNSWLLIKHRDEFAKDTDITKKDKSVVSGKTLKDLTAAASKRVKGEASPKAATPAAAESAKKQPVKKKPETNPALKA